MSYLFIRFSHPIYQSAFFCCNAVSGFDDSPDTACGHSGFRRIIFYGVQVTPPFACVIHSHNVLFRIAESVNGALACFPLFPVRWTHSEGISIWTGVEEPPHMVADGIDPWFSQLCSPPDCVRWISSHTIRCRRSQTSWCLHVTMIFRIAEPVVSFSYVQL